MSTEAVFTRAYLKNSWGSKESRSGPSASLERTAALRTALPELFRELEIQSVLDCGCGDWNWMCHVDLTGIQYIGCDIVPQLVETLQQTFSAETVNFQVLNLLQDPPDTADLWLARDLCSLFSSEDTWQFFQKFLDSGSKYLAITSVETEDTYQDTFTGAWVPRNFLAAPFSMPPPLKELDDGEQWFLKKSLFIYEREQILGWITTKAAKFELVKEQELPKPADRGVQIPNNIPLRKMKLNGMIAP
jgi:SAM-dependent methyltransferase